MKFQTEKPPFQVILFLLLFNGKIKLGKQEPFFCLEKVLRQSKVYVMVNFLFIEKLYY